MHPPWPPGKREEWGEKGIGRRKKRGKGRGIKGREREAGERRRKEGNGRRGKGREFFKCSPSVTCS